jgi:nucleotide-binding universal stress UspA family protein
MRVLVASDGSSDAMQAAKWLAASGVPTGASILVLSVVAPPGVPFLPTPVAESLKDEGRSIAEQTRAVVSVDGANIAARVAEGDAREEIMRVADDWDADLVVMGARGLGRVQGFLLGTVSLAVVRHCTRPVLVVKGRTRALGSAIVTLDGSEDALNALRLFARWPKLADLAVHLVGVIEPLPFPRTAPKMIQADLQAAASAAEGERREALKQAFAAARPLLPSGRIIETLTSGEPASQILRIADEHAIDLIVLGARGLGAAQRLLLGSVSEAVLQGAQCAVLIAKRAGR